MSRFSDRLIERSGYSRDRFAQGYDAHRPAPPPLLLDVLAQLAEVERPALVVDLGSGTGLSSRVWAERAERVVGVEPNPHMKARAEEQTHAANVEYIQAYASDTGLADGGADIVTCSQSLHWMEPEPTFAEVVRLLRKGGVFAAYDYDWPPAVRWPVEAAFAQMLERGRRLRRERDFPMSSLRKEDHLARMRASGHFRYTRELLFHAEERGNAGRIVGMALSLGPLAKLLDEGVSEEELGLAELRRVVRRELGGETVRLLFCYRARLGVK